MTAHDVYSFGVVSSSTLYTIAEAFPSAEGYAEIDAVHHMTGGEAANSSIVLSRLGVQVKLDGSWLGADDAGIRTKAILDEHGIDTTRLPLQKGQEGAEEMVIAAEGTRTIFGTYGRLLAGKQWNQPHEDDAASAQVICLDPFFSDTSYRVAAIGNKAGIPVVTVDCLYDEPMLEHVSAVVIAESFLRENYPEGSLDDIFRRYQDSTPGLVIFTFGAAGIRYARPGEAAKTSQPRPVQAIDTSGAGDSFRAGIVYGFLKQWGDLQMIEFASALAALVCTRSPGVLNSPNLDEVTDFMR